ncbi:hypothetical protein D3C73_1033560 [compost metagenome]
MSSIASFPFSPTVARRIASRWAVPIPSPTKRITFLVFEVAASAGPAICVVTPLATKIALAALTAIAALNPFFFQDFIISLPRYGYKPILEELYLDNISFKYT